MLAYLILQELLNNGEDVILLKAQIAPLTIFWPDDCIVGYTHID